MDYAALAKQYGGTTAAPAVDYAALAKQFGGTTGVESGIPTTRQGVDQFGIPITVRPAEKEAPLTLREKISGAVETPVALAANLVSGPITYLAGAGGPEFQRSVASQIQYQPRTRVAQQALEAVGQGLEATKLPPFMPMIGGATNALAPAVRAAGDVARSEGSLISGSVNQMAAKRAGQAQNALAAQSYARAPIIDAAQAANRTGLVVNPAITNPTVANKAKGLVVGPAFEDAAVKVNAAKTTSIVRKDLGLSSTDPLNASAVEKALDTAGKPYDVVRKMPSLTPDKGIIDSMESLKVPTLIGDEGSAIKVNGLIDKAIESVNEGRSGELIIQDIRQLRKQAQNVYKARDAGSNPSAADVAAADARMGIANSLESLIDANAPNPKVLADIKAARIRMAQIYDHDRAINYANETIDPQAYAKMLNERKGNMSGVGADIGKVAATFPEVMSVQSPTAQVMPAVKRSGLGAAGGALVGGAVGGYPGAIAGATMGGTLGWAGTQGLAKGMTKAEYQAARAVPKDYRNKLAPANNKTNALAK